VGPRTCLDAVVKRKILSPCRDSNTGRSVRSLVTIPSELSRHTTNQTPVTPKSATGHDPEPVHLPHNVIFSILPLLPHSLRHMINIFLPDDICRVVTVDQDAIKWRHYVLKCFFFFAGSVSRYVLSIFKGEHPLVEITNSFFYCILSRCLCDSEKNGFLTAFTLMT
jgi:hypothetical protein